MKDNKINGISGCKIEIFNSQVSKTSSSIIYNQRLIEQLNKQLLFSKFSISGVNVPTIKESGYANDLIFFTMDYIPGHNPIDYFLKCNIRDIHNFISNIESYFNFLEKNVSNDDIKIFKTKNIEKIQNLHNKIDYDFRSFSDYLIKKIDNLSSKQYPRSICHGDLTLSNMICCDNQIYLIDFLDSYINTLIIDLVKLKQDLYHKWTLFIFFDLNSLDNIRINQILDFIWNNIRNKFSKYIDTEEFLIIEALNFLRILPYTKKESMKLFVEKIIKSLEIYEEFNNTNGGKIIEVSKCSS